MKVKPEAEGAQEKKSEEAEPAKTSKTAKRAKQRQKYRERLRENGKEWVTFIVPLDLWQRFVAEKCQGVKPNDLFISWLKEQTTRADG